MWCNNNICNPQTSCTLRTSTVLAMRGAYCICRNLPAEAETTSTARTERDKQTNKQRRQERGNELAAWLIGISSGSLGLATHEPCHEEEGRACVRKCARFLVCSLDDASDDSRMPRSFSSVGWEARKMWHFGRVNERKRKMVEWAGRVWGGGDGGHAEFNFLAQRSSKCSRNVAHSPISQMTTSYFAVSGAKEIAGKLWKNDVPLINQGFQSHHTKTFGIKCCRLKIEQVPI